MLLTQIIIGSARRPLCPFIHLSNRKREITGVMPGYYYPQVQLQMEIFNLDMTHFVEYRPESTFQAEQLVITEVPRNREWFANQLPAMYKFWCELDRKRRIMEEIERQGLFSSSDGDRNAKKRLRDAIEERHKEEAERPVEVSNRETAVFDMPVDPPKPKAKRRKKIKFDFCRLTLEESDNENENSDTSAEPSQSETEKPVTAQTDAPAEPMALSEPGPVQVPDDPWG